MTQPLGTLIVTDPRLPRAIEIDTITCCHCQTVVPLHNDDGTRRAADAVGGFCTLCMRATCPGCAARGECTPFEAKLVESERRGRLRAAIGV